MHLNRRVKNILSGMRALVGMVLMVYVVSAGGGWSALKPLIHTAWLFPALVALTILGTAIESKRLGVLLRSQEISLSFRQGCRLVAVATFFNSCIPGGTGGDVMKLYYLAQGNRNRVVEVATVLLADRAAALFSLLTLAVGFAALSMTLVRDHSLVKWLVVAALIGAVALVVIGAISCSTRLRTSRWYRSAISVLPFHRYLERASDALGAFRNHKKALLGAVLLSALGHLALAAMFLALGRVLVPGVPGVAVALLAFLGLLANALPVTPGGLGVGEMAFEQLFQSIGVLGGASLILAWRAGMLPLCVIGGVLYIIGIHRIRYVTEPAVGVRRLRASVD